MPGLVMTSPRVFRQKQFPARSPQARRRSLSSPGRSQKNPSMSSTSWRWRHKRCLPSSGATVLWSRIHPCCGLPLSPRIKGCKRCTSWTIAIIWISTMWTTTSQNQPPPRAPSLWLAKFSLPHRFSCSARNVLLKSFLKVLAFFHSFLSWHKQLKCILLLFSSQNRSPAGSLFGISPSQGRSCGQCADDTGTITLAG